MTDEKEQATPLEDSGAVTTQQADLPVDSSSVRRPKKFGVRKLGLLAICLVGGTLALLIANVPSHVLIRPNGSSMLLPSAGYTWVAPNDAFDWQVQWTPGTYNPTLSNVIAASEEGAWRPAPGYAWTDTTTHSATGWVPNSREKEFSHVTTGDKPDSWILDPGYVPAEDWSTITPHAIWKPGIRDNRFPHIESAAEESHWIIDPGYSFAFWATSEAPQVVWESGKRRADSPHVFAAAVEGHWQLDVGYSWLNRNDPDDFRVVSPARIVDVWNAMIYADSAVSQMSCTSVEAIESAVEAARDRYGAISASESHPLLEGHIQNTYTVLADAAKAFQNCRAADDLGSFVDGAGSILCFFADDSDECMRKKNMLVNGGGTVVSLACQEAGKNARSEFDRITRERQDLQGRLEGSYNLHLPVTPLVACR
jgi:hypothetical protein